MALERLLAATPPPSPLPQGEGESGADPIGIQGNAATLAGGNTLAVMSGGTTLDRVPRCSGWVETCSRGQAQVELASQQEDHGLEVAH